MTKAITTPNNDFIAQWKERQNYQEKLPVNYIKLINTKLSEDGKSFNPDFGKLFAVRYELDLNGEAKEIKTEIDIKKDSFFCLKQRVQIKCGKNDKTTGKPLYWAREVDMAEDYIELHDQTGEVVATDMYRNLKEKYDLKFNQALYIYFKGFVYRWTIGGSNLSAWFTMSKLINGALKQGRLITFKVAAIEEQQAEMNGQKAPIFFNVLTFATGEEDFNPETAIKILDQVDATLAKYYSKIKEDQKAKELEATQEVVDVDYDTDLPFGN